MNFFPFQIQALDTTQDQNRVAYYMDMGLGKTYVGTEKMKRLGARVNLVICQKSKIEDWLNHVFENYEDFECYDLTKKDEFDTFIRRSDDDYEREFEFGNPICGVINYELAWRRDALRCLRNFTLMLDESSLIQNDTAKRTKFILNLNPLNVVLLSGTPTSGKYENLWPQIHLLGWPISKELYNRQYVNWKTEIIDDRPVKMVDPENPYKYVDRLKDKLRQYGAFFMKTEECFTLPEQNFIPVSIPTIPEYRRFRKRKLVTVEDGIELVGDSILAERLYSRMLCGQYNPHKLEAFADLVQSTNERLIVFYNFNEELTRLTAIADDLKRPVSQVNGAVKDLTAYEEADDSITFIQYQAGAMGLNLQKANRIVYFTLTDKSELYEQSKKRIHRIGQERPCFYYILLCKNSVEEHILETLDMRRDYTDELFKESED